MFLYKYEKKKISHDILVVYMRRMKSMKSIGKHFMYATLFFVKRGETFLILTVF